MDNYDWANMRKRIARLARRGALRDKKLILFGATLIAGEINACLLERGLTLSGIIDNDHRKIGAVCQGLPVQSPDGALLPYDSDAAVLIFSGGFYREMTSQLVRLGYARDRQIFILNTKADESLPIMASRLARVLRGLAAYRKLAGRLTGRGTVFVAPYSGTGDIYLIGLFFSEYLQQKAIKDYLFLVVNGACAKVAAMFGIGNIVVTRPTTIDSLILCHTFLRADWPLVELNDGWGRETSQWLRGCKGLNFEKMFRYLVFGFDSNAPHRPPSPGDHRRAIDALFQRHGLRQGKTVVLSPYSNTLFGLPDDLWQNIVRHCVSLGYTVCTNCAGQREKPVAATPGIFFPLDQAVAFVEAAGFFIGARSGLCDIISAAACRKIILYDRSVLFYASSQIAYFSLGQMGLGNDAIEIEYSDATRAQCLETILAALS
ncbi:MAG: hypothetical protein LBK98_00545 [Peptococcaceae bacterium]|jgi:hypothetical protein|nr:hypothetical protein [Peptococcaceae bacterium]